jgi:hypothetical protein
LKRGHSKIDAICPVQMNKVILAAKGPVRRARGRAFPPPPSATAPASLFRRPPPFAALNLRKRPMPSPWAKQLPSDYRKISAQQMNNRAKIRSHAHELLFEKKFST